ncbi:MAG: hypothetical protein ACRC46_07365 [Thermoguttaceae bacterium]
MQKLLINTLFVVLVCVTSSSATLFAESKLRLKSVVPMVATEQKSATTKTADSKSKRKTTPKSLDLSEFVLDGKLNPDGKNSLDWAGGNDISNVSVSFSTTNKKEAECDESEYNALHACYAKVADAIFNKDFQTALDTLDRDDERRCEQGDNLKSRFMAVTMRSAIYEWQGKPREAVKLIEELSVKNYQQHPEICIGLNLILGSICIRTGEYDLAVETMTRQIERLNSQIALVNESGDNGSASVLYSMLSACYYHRSLARYILGESQTPVDDFILSIDSLKKAKWPQAAEWTFRRMYKDFFDPLAKSLTGNSEAFVVVPQENQVPIELNPNGLRVEMLFKFDVKYPSDESSPQDAQDKKIFDPFKEHVVKIRDALLAKDFQAASDGLNLAEESINDLDESFATKDDKRRNFMLLAMMRGAIYEWQGSPREAVRTVEEWSLADYPREAIAVLYNSHICAICGRSGEYDWAIEVMTRRIEKLDEQIAIADESGEKEWTAILRVMLAQCYYYRSLAGYMQHRPGEDVADDYFQSVSTLKKAMPMSRDIALLVQQQCRDYFTPLAALLGSPDNTGDIKSKTFRIVPRKDQEPFSVLHRCTEKIEVNATFGFDVEYPFDELERDR